MSGSCITVRAVDPHRRCVSYATLDCVFAFRLPQARHLSDGLVHAVVHSCRRLLLQRDRLGGRGARNPPRARLRQTSSQAWRVRWLRCSLRLSLFLPSDGEADGCLFSTPPLLLLLLLLPLLLPLRSSLVALSASKSRHAAPSSTLLSAVR